MFLTDNICQQMVRDNSVGVCEHCHSEFAYYIVHNGFNDSAYAYCDACETSAILSGWYKAIPPEANLRTHQRVQKMSNRFLSLAPAAERSEQTPIQDVHIVIMFSIHGEELPGSKRLRNAEGVQMAEQLERPIFDRYRG